MCDSVFLCLRLCAVSLCVSVRFRRCDCVTAVTVSLCAWLHVPCEWCRNACLRVYVYVYVFVHVCVCCFTVCFCCVCCGTFYFVRRLFTLFSLLCPALPRSDQEKYEVIRKIGRGKYSEVFDGQCFSCVLCVCASVCVAVSVCFCVSLLLSPSFSICVVFLALLSLRLTCALPIAQA